MCGIAGLWAPHDPDARAGVEAMVRALRHRGPDGNGVWSAPHAGPCFGHTRLAIIDLSVHGHQPMRSGSGRYTITFNGEIYNHLDLRRQLGAVQWRGHSDTETLLAGFDAWGIEKTLRDSVGMFALAVWDQQSRALTLARDRFGEKPLYFGWPVAGPATFMFASELKALRAYRGFKPEIDRAALGEYLRHNCVPGTTSIYAGVHKLPPGNILTLSDPGVKPLPASFSTAAAMVQGAHANRFPGTPEESVDELERLLRDAIRQQMLADVPLGAFLSGGVDSSTVVALMQAQSARPVKTFSIGFHDDGYNEAEQAKAVATHLGTDHTELYVSAQQAMSVIPQLPTLYCEPFADASQIPTFLVSELARQHVTVSLSGDAGDELFCGYNRYQFTSALWRKLKLTPRPLRRLVGAALLSVSTRSWDRLAGHLPVARLGEKLHKAAPLLSSGSVSDLYRAMVSQWPDPSDVVLGAPTTAEIDWDLGGTLRGLSDVERMMACDLLGYLPDDILVKVDRAAMGVSLETRVPLLDPQVVDFAWRLPIQYKLRSGVTKWPLRQVLYRHVPRNLVDRPKMGFGVPIGEWLRGSLRDWAEELLSESRLRSEGYFRPEPIRRRWAEHQAGKRNWQDSLWGTLMFQAWLESQRAS